MNKKFFLCVSLICFSSNVLQPLHAAPSSIEAYESKTVSNINVIMENLPPDAPFNPQPILAKLKTKIGDPFSQMTFDSDLKTLWEEYDRVDPDVSVKNGDVQITIRVWPKPLIHAIEWEGNKHIKTKTLGKELGIKPNTTFNRQAFNKAFNKLKEFYIKKGYFESELQYSVVTNPKTNQVDIKISVKEGRSGNIDNIIFKGFTKTEKSELLDMIYTKKYNLFTSWFTGHGIYREEMIEQDQLTIINYLQNRGYADAKVNIQVKEAKSTGRIILEVKAERGEVFHFGKITFDGNKLFTDKQVEAVFLARPQGVFSPEKLRDTQEAIKQLYGRKGYIDANVQYETKLALNEPVYNVHFTIDEGQQYKIGIIRIFGNVQTEARVILRESLLVPGETFDTARLKATQTRLENIGYFKSVNVYAVRTQDDDALGENYRDVYIEVEETTTGNLSLFFGFSTAEELFGGLDLMESNFNYKGIPKVFSRGIKAIRGGGEYAHAKATIGAKQRTYSVSWMNPYFRDTLWRVGFEANQSLSKLQSSTYDIEAVGGSLFASYPLTQFWTFGTKYRIRNAVVHTDKGVPLEEKKEARNTGLISAAGVSLSYDSVDHPRKPHNGYRSLLEGEVAGIGGEFSFVRLGFLNTYYTALWKHGIMKYHFDFKFIIPFGMTKTAQQVPLSERFYLGGETTVRGYKAFSIGPTFGNGSPEGGTSYSLYSVEYLQELLPFADAFVFADAGTLSLNNFMIKNLKLSYGYGLRLEVIGKMPIIIGMGYPVNPEHKYQVRKFFISMGGQF
jgi:outer membrane protein insertion porin family